MVGLMETRRRIMLNTPHLETLTEPLVSFDTDVPADFKEHKLYIKPIQDLHGYDHPWPAGGGKNLLQLTTDYLKTVNSSGVWSGNVCVINELSFTINTDNAGTVIGITVNGSASDNTSFIIGKRNELLTVGESYTFSGSPTNGTADTYCMQVANPTWTSIIGSRTITMVESTVNNIIIRIGSGVTCNNVIFRPMICISTATDPTTFSPYSNICPISGRTGVEVYNDSVYGGMINWNQLNALNNANVNSVINADNTVTVFSEAHTSDAYGRVSILQDRTFDSNHVYMIYTPGYFNDMGVQFYSAASSSYAIQSGREARFYKGISATSTIVRALIRANESAVSVKTTVMLFDLTEMFGEETANYVYSLETERAGSGLAWFKNLFPKNWYPYSNGEETCVSDVNGELYQYYSIIFPSEAGTVYGGTLDMKTGVLTVDRAIVDLGTLNWIKSETYRNLMYCYPLGIKSASTSERKEGILTSHYKISSTTTLDNRMDNMACLHSGTKFYVKDTTLAESTAAEIKAAMSGVQLVYELATPTTYQLTPHTLKALRGVNNIWSSEYVNTQVRFWTHKKEDRA